MRRLTDYFKFLAWQTGLGYLALWALTFWTLDEGAAVFGRSGVCRPDEATVLFYWVCDPGSALGILATVANVALTATVWAPVYVAAATVQADAMAIAGPIVAVHVIGLPLGIFVLMRLMATALDLRRRIPRARPQVPAASEAAAPAQFPPLAVFKSAPAGAVATPVRPEPAAAQPLKLAKNIPPRGEFGLRSRVRP